MAADAFDRSWVTVTLKHLEIEGIRCIYVGAPLHLSPRKQTVELLVRNPNRSKVTSVHIFMPSHFIEINIDEILGNDEKREVIEVVLRREETSVDKKNVATLRGYYTFDHQGEKKSGEVQIDILTRRIVDVSDTEDRLLEF